MAQKYEHTSTGNGFHVRDGFRGTKTQVIDGDGKLLQASMPVTALQYAEIALTAAEIKALRATPKELVASPGAGYVLEFVSAQLYLDATATAFTETADNMAVRFNNGTGAIVSQAIEATDFIDQTADTITNALPKIDAIVAKTGSENKSLVLHNTGDGEYATGTGVMRVKVSYRIHATGF